MKSGWKTCYLVMSLDGTSAGFQGLTWGAGHTYGIRSEAICQKGKSHKAPDRECKCGFHAYTSEQDAWALQEGSYQSDSKVVHGKAETLLEVALSGTVITFDNLHRSERQRITRVIVGSCFCGRPGVALGATERRLNWQVLSPCCTVHLPTLTGDIAISFEKFADLVGDVFISGLAGTHGLSEVELQATLALAATDPQERFSELALAASWAPTLPSPPASSSPSGPVSSVDVIGIVLVFVVMLIAAVFSIKYLDHYYTPSPNVAPTTVPAVAPNHPLDLSTSSATNPSTFTISPSDTVKAYVHPAALGPNSAPQTSATSYLEINPVNTQTITVTASSSQATTTVAVEGTGLFSWVVVTPTKDPNTVTIPTNGLGPLDIDVVTTAINPTASHTNLSVDYTITASPSTPSTTSLPTITPPSP